MVDKTQKKQSWRPRLLGCVFAALLLLVLTVIAGRVFVTTESGTQLIERQINKRSFGPINRIELSGLSGDPLGNFSLGSVRLFDNDGAFFSAEKVSISWNPWALKYKVIDISVLEVDVAQLERKPRFAEQPPRPRNQYAAQLERGRIKNVSLNENVLGQAAEFSISGKMHTENNGAISADLIAIQIDKTGDKLNLDFTRDVSGNLSGVFDVTGAAGGTLARLIRAPKGSNVIGSGEVSGSVKVGQSSGTLSFGGQPKLQLNAQWSNDDAKVQAKISAANWPLFDQVRSGLGDNINARAILNRTSNPSKFELEIGSRRLTARASGEIDPRGGLPETANISMASDDLGAILPLPEGFAIGAGQLNGKIESQPFFAFSGEAKLESIQTPFGQAGTLSGPLKLLQGAQQQYSLSGDWGITDLIPNSTIPIIFAEKTTLSARAQINSRTKKIGDISLGVNSGETELRLTGKADYNARTFDISGVTQLRVKPMGVMAGGILQSNFRADALSDLAVNLSVDGAYKPDVALAEPWRQMVQNGANFNADMTLLSNAIRVDEAFVTGENVRAAISGSLGDELDLSAKVEIAAPFNYAPLSLIGNTDANLTLKGARDNPDLRLDANFEQIQINAFNLRDTRLRAELSGVFMAPKGPVRFNAKTDQGPLDLSAKLASSASAYTADDISLSWGIISATGQISKPLSEPATGQLFLNGAQTEDQFAKASLRLSPLNGRQGISLKADAKNVAFQDFAFDEFKLAADGSLSSLSGTLETRGQRELQILARQFRVAAPFTISRETDGSYRAAIEPRANYANIELGHVSALTVIYANDEITLDAPLTLAGEPFNLTYERSGPKESVSLKTANLPVTLIPMSGSLADSRGRLAADISLSNAAAIAGLTGGGKISISDWRGFDAKKDNGLFGTLALEVNGREMTWLSDVKSASGFSATSNGVLPLRVSDTLTGFGIAMDAPISGELIASGQASAILGLVTPSDARPQGQLKARLQLSGTAKAPFVKGDASAEEIRMEAPQLGTQLKNGMFAAQFSNDNLSVSDLSIEDKDNGKISGSGQFRLGEFARPIGELNMTANKFRAIDRKDYQGTVSGSLGFKSTQNEVSLTGDVTLNRAEVKQFVESKAYVVEIPVEEINKPEEVPLAVVSPPSAPVRLDIRLRGPRRIFIRSRGLDVELSIDAALKGPSNNVEIYGQANVLRGNYKLAGKSLNFDSGGIEFSGTLPDARINLKASTKTPSLAAELVIRGTASNPEVELSSTPDRPQDEILSALLFGRSATELTALEAAQLAGAIAQFSGSGSGFDLMSGLRDALGVGQLDFALGQDGTAQITGGRYLAKNIYLQVFSGGGVGKTGALIDWEISENIALSSKIQADNDQSFSLKWNKDF